MFKKGYFLTFLKSSYKLFLDEKSSFKKQVLNIFQFADDDEEEK